MNSNLIINVRSHLSWYHRLSTDVMTAVLWGGWLYLWRPLAGLAAWVHSWGVAVRPTAMKSLMVSTPVTLEGVLALLGTSGTLILWSLLPAQRAARQQRANTVQECAQYFELPEQTIQDGREQSVCVVHHDEAGRITRIETVVRQEPD